MPQCWRVHPTEKERVQILNLEGKVIRTVKVRKSKKFSHGYFQVIIKGKSYNLKRHPDDTANLEENGFATGKKPSIYTGTTIPFFVDGVDITPNNNQFDPDMPNETFKLPQNTIQEVHGMDLDALFPEGMNDIEEFLDGANNLRLSQLPGSVDFSWLGTEDTTLEISEQDPLLREL